jgi:hypothetical protein
MKRRTVRLALGLWCLAIVYGMTIMTDQRHDSEASQTGPVITSQEEVSAPEELLDETIAVAKEFLLQGFPSATIREFLFRESVASHYGRETPVR